jgi:hypothetical protein
VAQALKLPYVAIELQQGDEPAIAAEYGDKRIRRQGDKEKAGEVFAPSPAPPFSLPLAYQGELVGQLLLAPRASGELFSPADQRLLDDLARHAGVAVHAVRLTSDLQRARERLVTAREEERRRLRRDLHDGLGPQLASQTLLIDTVFRLLPNDIDGAIVLLQRLKSQSQGAIADIRRLVYALRPPALDDLGLVGALREHAMQYAQSGTQITVVTHEQLPPLPAADRSRGADECHPPRPSESVYDRAHAGGRADRHNRRRWMWAAGRSPDGCWPGFDAGARG